MKHKILFLSLFFLVMVSLDAHAQQRLAPILMRLTNGAVFANKNIPFGRPVTLIYFSPECEHCDALAKALAQSASRLKGKEIIMVTYLPMPPVIAFDNKYGLSRSPYIHIGSEGLRLTIKNYYQVQNFPFLALYDSRGRLVKTYARQENPELLVRQIAQLR